MPAPPINARCRNVEHGMQTAREIEKARGRSRAGSNSGGAELIRHDAFVRAGSERRIRLVAAVAWSTVSPFRYEFERKPAVN